MERYFVITWFGAIVVLVYLLVKEFVAFRSDVLKCVVPDSSDDEFDPTFANDPFSYDYANPNNVGHGIAYDE
jgi:hypothetical protein